MDILKHIFKIFTIIFFLLIVFYFSCLNLSTGATIFAVFAMFFLLMFYGCKFEIVEILGAKFKLKELNNSINELKKLSKTLACISLDLVQRNGRWNSHNTEAQKIEFFNKIDEILDSVNISQIEKQKIYDEYWHNWVIFDFSRCIKDDILNKIRISNDITETVKQELIALCNGNNSNKNILDIYERAKNNGVNFDANMGHRIKDFKYYLENKKHKDVEQYKQYMDNKEQ